MFSTFNEFYLSKNHNLKTYELYENVQWEVGKKGSGFIIKIPEGTRFDISNPKIFRWFQSVHDRKVLLAAALHDQLLEQKFDKAFASGEFRRACIARGVNKYKAWVLYFATLVWTIFKK